MGLYQKKGARFGLKIKCKTHKVLRGLLTKRDEPEERIVSEDSSEILTESPIVWLSQMERVLFFVALFQELNRCVLLRDQEDMEAEKAGEDEG